MCITKQVGACSLFMVVGTRTFSQKVLFAANVFLCPLHHEFILPKVTLRN